MAMPDSHPRTHQIKSFSRFLGSFEPIFDPNIWGQYQQKYIAPKFWSRKAAKIIQKLDEKFY